MSVQNRDLNRTPQSSFFMSKRFLKLMMFMALAMFVCTPMLSAQDGGDGDGDDAAGNTGGVEIDAKGVFKSKALIDSSGVLDRQRFQAAQAALNKDIKKQSKFRKVSLNRMEAEIAKLKKAGKPIPPEMTYMAGLTRISHVFYFPDTKDVVIAGPAEGFYLNGSNYVVGMKSGAPVLQLQDMAVALRTFGPDGKSPKVLSCSIDPTQQGLKQLKQAYSYAQQQNFQAGDAGAVVDLFRNSLGMQTITVKGVSPKTHFAQVMVDADYHMKLIGIGLERPPVRIKSFIEKASPTAVAKNSLQRWYFQPNYDYVRVSADEKAMALEGGGVELVGEDERVSVGGVRSGTGKMNRASTGFCRSFTKMYGALSEKAPLYAELRNLVDMSVAAAFIQEMDFYGDANWDLKVFGSEQAFPVENYNAPTHVAPAINAVWKGQYFMTPIGGGVNIQPRAALQSNTMKVDETGDVDKAKKEVQPEKLADGQWWWD